MTLSMPAGMQHFNLSHIKIMHFVMLFFLCSHTETTSIIFYRQSRVIELISINSIRGERKRPIRASDN